ncbi:MAG: CxxC-x17-CxxC domain-containing protein [Candidatus Omnitrophota bacterium]
MKKRTKSKKSSSDSAAADQDIAVLLTTLVQKLTSFEAKIDTVLSRIPALPFAAPRQQPTPAAAPSTERYREPRPMHKAICADCGRDCEVPFKPSAGRPVYCKECFTTRRNTGTFKPSIDSRPKENSPAQARPTEKPQAAEPAKPVKKKKQPAKKKSK